MSIRTIPSIAAAFCLMIMLAAPAALSANRPSDKEITYWVKQALKQDPRINSSRIAAATQDGIVDLSGSVDNLAAKQYSIQESKKIKGVVGVIDRVEVRPVYRFDTDIAQDVRRRIIDSAVIESQKIKVSCVDGRVRLQGQVASWGEYQEASLLATQVRGVKEVQNRLTVIDQGWRSDQAIKNDIVAAFRRKVQLTGYPITVDVQKGRVTLTGWVGNSFEWDQADLTARWTDNVNSVDNRLEVKWWENRGLRGSSPHLTDAERKKAVRETLDHDSRIDSSKIKVGVDLGTVTLSGTVEDHYQKRVASQDALDVVGVAWVDNKLFVQADQRSDDAVRDDVVFNLDSDSALGVLDIGVQVNKSVVTLRGKTPTWYEKMHAEDVASKVRGVRKIINHIKVDWDSPRSDSFIASMIRKRLTTDWLTYSASDKIIVEVTDGVATLKGDVHSWDQRQEAERVAFNTYGVWLVKNHLAVEDYDYPWSKGSPSIQDRNASARLFDDWTARYDRFWW